MWARSLSGNFAQIPLSRKFRDPSRAANLRHGILFLLSKRKNLNFEHFWPRDFLVRNCGHVFYGVSVFLTWNTSAGPTLHWEFIRFTKGYYLFDHFSISPHQLLNVPDTRRTAQRWPSVGRNTGPAGIGQAGKKNKIHRNYKLAVRDVG